MRNKRRLQYLKCQVEDCFNIHACKGLCNAHYQRKHKGLTLGKVAQSQGEYLKKYNNANDIISKNIDCENLDGCWDWNGCIQKSGHGTVRTTIYGKSQRYYAHRISYENFIGSLDDELVIDHLCENKKCVNPFHLEQVTSGENVKRYHSNRRLDPYIARSESHCRRLHEYTESNTTYYGIYNQKRCKKCNVFDALEWRAKKTIDTA